MPAFPFLLTDFDVDRILSLENTKLGTLFTVLVSVGRRLLAHSRPDGPQSPGNL